MQDFTNHSIDLDTLPKYQEVPFLPIHKKYWNIMVINLLIFTIFILGAVAITFISVFSSDETNVGAGFYISILIGVLLVIGLLFMVNRMAFRKRGYAVREKDILCRSGVLSTTTTIIPFNRIQHIAVNEGMFSRMYGLASLEIYTAGGNSSDLSISGIEKQTAYDIKEFLMNNVNDNINSNDNGNLNDNNSNDSEPTLNLEP